jgi:predicted  nucleic acid-binding Zn-ribbon protein
MIGQFKTNKYQDKVGRELHSQLKNNLVNRLKGNMNEAFVYNDKGEIQYDENGKPEIDKEKLVNLFKQNDNQLTLNKLADIAALSGNKEDYHLFQSILDFNYFQPFFQQGEEGLNILKKHIQNQLSESESKKLNQEILLDMSSNTNEIKRVAELIGKVDEYYKLYDNIANRHIFNMPKLEGGTKADKAEFSNLILAKKLEKVILKDQLLKINLDLNTQVFNLASKNLIDPITKEVINQGGEVVKLNEADQQELDLIGGKEKQYNEVLKSVSKDNDILYNKEELSIEYRKWLASKESKKEEDAVKDATNEELIAKLSKDLATAGYKMDTEHILDPAKKAIMTPEQLEKHKGADKFFTFELNGKEYEAYSSLNPDGSTYRVYRDAVTKQVIGKFDIEFLKKNRGIKIISKQEASDKKKLAKLKANKDAKLKSFTAVYNSLNQKLLDNEGKFIDLENQKRVIEEEIAVYQEWLNSIINKFGYRAINGKALEKQQINQEIANLKKLLDSINSQIEEINNIYESLQGQLELLNQIKEDVNIIREDNKFTSEDTNITYTESHRKIQEEINNELEKLIEEEQQLNDIINTTSEAVAKAEQKLKDAVELETEIMIIYEDLVRVKDINDIVNALLTADPKDLGLILAKYKPLKIIVDSLAKLRDNVITEEEYLKVITLTNNILTEKYLGFGFEGLEKLKREILTAADNANKLPISNEAQYYIDINYFLPTSLASKLVGSKQFLLDNANKMLGEAIGKQYTSQELAQEKSKQLSEKEKDLNDLMNDLFIQYRKALNRSVKISTKIAFNSIAPDQQAPEVYEEDNGTINPSSYLSNYIFRNIGQDLEYDPETGETEDGGDGLPKLNLTDQNYRRLAQFIAGNPKIAEKYNVRFFVGRTDDEGKKSVDIGGKSNDELLGLYETFESSPGSLDIGFYFVDKDGKVASENYNGETKTVVGWIPKTITDAKGNLRVNNAAAVRIATSANGVFFDYKTNTKVINEYNFTTDNGIHTFEATNYGKQSDITVEVIDGKAVIKTRFDNLLPNISEVELTEEKAKLIADLLKENTKYSLSKAGKEIQSVLKDSKSKYRTNINLSRTKTKLIENQGIIDTYGEVTVDELIEKVKEELIGKPGKEGLYTAMVINPIVEQIETNKKPALTRIQTITRGVPIKQYNTNEDGTRNFQEPISHKITDVFSVELRKGELDGGTLDIVNFTNQDTLGSSLGKVVLKTDNGEVAPLEQRNLNPNEILTALYIMSFGDNMAQEAPEFGVTKEGKPYRMDTGDGKFHSRYRFFPFSSTSTGSAITSLLYWGKHTEDFYVNAEGKQVPISSNKVGEIFAHEGNIYFKKKVSKGVWIDSSISIDALKTALESPNPFQDPGIRDLVDFLADKRVNVNKQLLLTKDDKMKNSLYFHPKVTRTATGYEFTYDTYNSYAEFLIKDVLTTTVNNEENFPKFANRQIVFRSKNLLKPDLSEKFVQPETTARPAPMKKKNSAATKVATAKTKAAKSTEEDTGDIDMVKGVAKIKGVLGKLKKAYQGKPDAEEVTAEEIENEPAAEKGSSVLDNTSTAGLISPAKKGAGKFAALANKTKKVC